VYTVPAARHHGIVFGAKGNLLPLSLFIIIPATCSLHDAHVNGTDDGIFSCIMVTEFSSDRQDIQN
jgi:hypothetical protein